MARHLASSLVDPEGLALLLASRLVALNKNPGVRPIGVCETVRRIITKAILDSLPYDVHILLHVLASRPDWPADLEVRKAVDLIMEASTFPIMTGWTLIWLEFRDNNASLDAALPWGCLFFKMSRTVTVVYHHC